MAKDQSIESHIAESKAKIEKAVPETLDTERHIDRTRQALQRSRELLEASRDPLEFAKLTGTLAISAAEDRPNSPRKPRALRTAKAKRRG